MTDARAWLPADAPTPAALDRALATIVTDWSNAWIGGEQIRLGVLDPVGSVRDRAWSTPGNGLSLGLSADAVRSFGAQVLDLAEATTVENDQAMVDEIGEDALSDLRARLAEFTGMATTADWRPAIEAPGGAGWRFATATGARGGFAVALSPALFATLARRKLPLQSYVPLANGTLALAATAVSVSARLGGCRLPLADIRSIAIGDVLILDTAIDDPVPLAVDGQSLSRGLCSVVTGETGAVIEIVQPILQ